jgi:hypothetical protein
MIQTCPWRFGAIAFCVLGTCQATWAQLYTSPTVQDALNRGTTAPSVNRQLNTLAFAQRNAGYGGLTSPINSALPGIGAYGGSRIGLGATTPTRSSKPFSSYSSAPTVSPYLNLFRTDLSGGGNFNYSTLVQPQLQQQQVNQQLERQAIQANRRIQSIAAQADYNPQGAKDQYPTGHQTVFNYTGRYYPVPQVRQKRR